MHRSALFRYENEGGYLSNGYGKDVVDVSCDDSWIEFRVNLNSMFISWKKNRRKNRVMGRRGEGEKGLGFVVSFEYFEIVSPTFQCSCLYSVELENFLSGRD